MNLTEIAKKYPSDKSDHGYMQYYQHHLPLDCKSLLEIGVLKGDSIRIWKEYLPGTVLYGADLFIENDVPEIDGVEWFKANQLDHTFLYHIRFNIKPQIIIEDASHNSIDQLVTFFSLIGCCEMYVCEDIFTAKEEFYRQGLPFESTMLGMMQSGRFPFEFSLYEDKIAFIKNKINTHATGL